MMFVNLTVTALRVLVEYSFTDPLRWWRQWMLGSSPAKTSAYFTLQAYWAYWEKLWALTYFLSSGVNKAVDTGRVRRKLRASCQQNRILITRAFTNFYWHAYVIIVANTNLISFPSCFLSYVLRLSCDLSAVNGGGNRSTRGKHRLTQVAGINWLNLLTWLSGIRTSWALGSSYINPTYFPVYVILSDMHQIDVGSKHTRCIRKVQYCWTRHWE